MRLARHAFALALSGLALFAPEARAQDLGQVQSEILVIDPNRLFDETLFGRRIRAELEAEAEALAADNRRLEEALETEELALTEQRATMEPELFRDAADAFDKKVQAVRREQGAKARALENRRNNAEQRFLSTAQSVLVEVMNARGGNLLLDIRTVLLRDQGIDITNEAVRRIDEVLGTGEGLDEPEPSDE